MTAPPIRDTPSPHFNERVAGTTPRYIVLHYTGTRDWAEAERHYLSPEPLSPVGPVSPHYMVDEDGAIARFVAEDKRAWHAGKSCWDGLEDLNSWSVGIEIVNPGHMHDYRPFPSAQMDAVALLCRNIMERHGIEAANVLGHSDIAPGRKIDPGELFDWPMLARHGIGLWPEPDQADFDQAEAMRTDESLLRQCLSQAGYDHRLDLPVLIAAFQRHYHPDVFEGDAVMAGVPTLETVARLRRLATIRLNSQA